MGIKEELLVCLMEISSSLKKIASELEEIKTNENKKRKELKEAATNNKVEEVSNLKLDAMKELYLDYCFGSKGENSGN